MFPAPVIVTTPGEREVRIVREFNAPRRLLWDCHTKPDLVRRWMLGPPGWTMPVCEIDLRVGGRFRYVWRKEDGAEMGMGGRYHEIETPERLVTGEIFDEDWTGGETLNTLVFIERTGRTTLTMDIVYSSKEARDGALQSGMTSGMEQGYAALDTLMAELG